MRHPAFHVSAKLVGGVSSVTGFLRQCECKKNAKKIYFSLAFPDFSCILRLRSNARVAQW